VYGHHRYKSFLHHVHKHKPLQKKVVKLASTKQLPKTLTESQLKAAFEACANLRDKLLLRLLYETGLRIGQALGLQHQDIQSWDNVIQIIPRERLVNGARTKSRKPYVVHVSIQLMQLYTEYINQFMLKLPEHSHVFINLTSLEPLNYRAVRQLFIRLSNKIGFALTPHMFRHTHATELICEGWDAAFVQKRLGHASVQTTLDIYSHLDTQDLKNAYKTFLSNRRKENE
jgi:integrase